MPDTRRLIIVGASAFVFSVALTILILGVSGRRGQSSDVETPLAMEPGKLSPSDFVLPQQGSADVADDFVPYRDRLQRWEEDQVQRYWVDVEEIVREILEEESDRAIEALLNTVD